MNNFLIFLVIVAGLVGLIAILSLAIAEMDSDCEWWNNFKKKHIVDEYPYNDDL